LLSVFSLLFSQLTQPGLKCIEKLLLINTKVLFDVTCIETIHTGQAKSLTDLYPFLEAVMVLVLVTYRALTPLRPCLWNGSGIPP
jgi:hypothetical protein